MNYADATKKEKKIKIISDEGEEMGLSVSDDVLDEVVRPLWGSKVRAIYEKKGARNVLVFIERT